MQTELHEMNVTLSNDQKQKISNAFIKCEKIRLILSKNNLLGSDTIIIPTHFFEETDNEDGIDAVVDKQTLEEIIKDLKKKKTDVKLKKYQK